MASEAGLISDQALGLRHLVKGADRTELKPNLPEHSCRSAGAALGVDPLDAQIRQVFFFDTPDFDLDKGRVVAASDGPRRRPRSSSSRLSCIRVEDRSVDPVTAVLDEAITEPIGVWRKRWALVVVVFVVGALGALCLTRGARAARPATLPVDAATS